MNLSEPFVRRPAMTTLLTVTAVLFGVLAFRQLPVNDLPAVDYPVITCSVAYPGASPETMANNIATPLERQFMQISGLETVTSSSKQGITTLTLQFNLEKSLDAAATDVQTAITQATGNLPVDLPSPPVFTKNNPNDQAIQYLVMYSNSVTAGGLYDYATQVQQRISIIYGVSRVDIYGTKAAVRVKAEPGKMASRNITMDSLANAIRGGTAYQGAGQFDGPNRTVLLQPQGQLDNAEEYNNLIIGSGKDGSAIHLRDVATAYDTVEDDRVNLKFWYRQLPTQPSAIVVLAVFRQAGFNAVEVAGKVRDNIAQIQSLLPGSVGLSMVHDRSESISNSAKDVETTLLIAFVLVVLVIFVFLGRVTDTLIPMVALPLSLLLTFIVMHILGYSLDNLSLMALTLAIGFLVDDAIVFLENTVSRLEHGASPFEATLHSAKQISFTILSMTISLASVFIPLLFMPGLVGRIFHEFAVTIIVSIIASGVVSLTLTPMMCSRMLARRGHGTKRTLMEKISGHVIDYVLLVYGRSLTWFLRYRWISLLVWIITMVGTLWLFQQVPKSFLPIGDSGFMFGIMIGQEGSSPARMRQLQQRAEDVVHANPNVEVTFTMTGNTQFLPSNFGLLLVFLKDIDQRVPMPGFDGKPMAPSIQNITQMLNGGLFMTIPGLIPALKPQPVLQISTGGTSNLQGQYAYTISGIEPDQVYAASQKLQGMMMGQMQQGKLFATVNSDLFLHTPNLPIAMKRDQASTYGVSVNNIESLLRQAYSQNYLYLIKRPQDQYKVILEVADAQRSQAEDLEQLYVHSDDGTKTLPLKTVMDYHQTVGPQSVNHLNQFTAVTISFNLKPGVPIGDATAFINGAAAQVVPTGIRGSLQGEAQEFERTIPMLIILILLAVFVMYVILGILYESYVHPITVLSSLPVALAGGLLTLYLFGAECSLYGFIGMFMLMGIVKKNGIMVIDFAIQRQNQGQDRVTAIHEASMDRFRPIMMTTLAALMGAIPIALGFGADASSRRPLGLVIVGGLIVSQFITLYITPVIYLYLEEFQERVLDKTSFFRATRHIVPPEDMVVSHRPDSEGEDDKVTG